MNRRVVLAAGLAIVVAAGGLWFGGRSSQPAMTPITLAAQAQEATSSATPSVSSVASKVPDMILGKEDAPVTILEYASYTCPHCAKFHETVWDKFKTNYIDTGKVKFIYREVYFDKFGLWAAMVARCGGPDKYFGISDILYNTQKDWLSPTTEQGIADALHKIGLSAGMTDDQVKACMNDQDQAKAMVTAYQTNATNDKIEGTPTFIINGEAHSGEMSYEEFAALVDAKLPK